MADALFLLPVVVIQPVFLDDKPLNLGLQRFPGGQLGNAMLPEIPGGCVGYDKFAFVCLPVSCAGFLGLLGFQPVPDRLGLGKGQHLALQLLFPGQPDFQLFQFPGNLPQPRMGGGKGCFQFFRGSKAVLLVGVQRRRHLFEVVHGRPLLIAAPLALGQFLLNVDKPL